MKHLLVTLCTLAALVPVAGAQTGFKTGFKFGVHFSNARIHRDLGTENFTERASTFIRGSLGLQFHIGFTEKMSLQPELLVAGRGIRTTGTVGFDQTGTRFYTPDNSNLPLPTETLLLNNGNGDPETANATNPDLFGLSEDVATRTELAYIQIPVLFRYNVLDKKITPFVATGPSFGFKVFDYDSYTRLVADDNTGIAVKGSKGDRTTFTPYDESDERSIYNVFDFGWVFAVGVKLPARLSLEFRYELGISNVLAPLQNSNEALADDLGTDAGTIAARNRGYGILLGFGF